MMAPAQLMDRLSTLEQENAQLRAQLDWFKRNLFGTGKSEKSDALQLRLGLSGEAPVEPQQQPETIQYKRANLARCLRSASRIFRCMKPSS